MSPAHNENSPESFAQLDHRQNIGLRSGISELIQLKEIIKNFTITIVLWYIEPQSSLPLDCNPFSSPML